MTPGPSMSCQSAKGAATSPLVDRPRVLVTQLGARRHYLVPATFASRGLLTMFYTDLYASGFTGRLLGGVARLLPRTRLNRLLSRHDASLPDRRVHSFPLFGLHSQIRSRRQKQRGQGTEHWLWTGRRFCQLVTQRGLGDADAVYAYSSAALELFDAARAAGRYCILDHATAPKRFEDALTMEQASRYPGWAKSPPSQDPWVDAYADRQNEEAARADLILCGSTFVRDAVEAEAGQGAKCVVVPLGLRRLPDAVEHKRIAAGRPLRILFVGDEAVRKGIGDLATAITAFGPHRCEVRVAGNIDLSEHGQREASRVLTLLGSVPRAEMPDQYRWADVCVLPSVSDTFGLVILEAMSHGVPVITTPNTGGADVIDNGRNGFIVPVMAPDAIAETLQRLDDDRMLVESLAAAARERSLDFGLDRYADRLISAVVDAYSASASAVAARSSEAGRPLGDSSKCGP